MLKWLKIFVVLLALAPFSINGADKETPLSLPGVNVVDTDTVKKWMDNGDSFFLLDARKPEDFQESRIPGATHCTVNIERTLEEAIIKDAVKWLEKCQPLKGMKKDHKIVTYCNGVACFQSPKASLALSKMGFTNIHWMREGMNVWKTKGYPIQ